jgi:thiamine biosynthesis lipoprotein
MCGKKKLEMRNWLKITSIIMLLWGCETSTKSTFKKTIQGETQGTTYHVILADADVDVSQRELDSILHNFDLILSSYIDSSLISQLNASEKSFIGMDSYGYFQQVYSLSEDVYKRSEGAFDPSVFPLVAGWGFMKKMETPLSKEEVDSILDFVSFEKDKLHSITFEQIKKETQISCIKKDPRFKLDFNALAQGLSVDVLASFLREKGCKNFYVEIGGEILVEGKNPEGEKWRIGIDSPSESNDLKQQRKIENILEIEDRALATSGNYRNFYIKNGKKYAHTLDPKTGFPVEHNVLSATVIAPTCAEADAYATVFMVIGLEETKRFLKKNADLDLDVYILYSDKNGKTKRFSTL